MPARRAFTLLEICLTLLIGMVLILLAVPSVAGLFAEQRLHESFSRFEQLANTARYRSIKDHQAYRLLWEQHGIALEAVSSPAGESKQIDHLAFSEDETYRLARVAAMVNPASEEWTFWPDGTCEPVVVSYRGHGGRWQVRYDAFTPRGKFLQSETL